MGKRLKELRGKRTQEEVSKKLGISRARYSHYENEFVQPDNDLLQTMADFYNVSVDSLLGREEGNPIELPVDFSDPAIFDKKFLYNGREVSEERRDMAIRTIREILRIPEDQ